MTKDEIYEKWLAAFAGGVSEEDLHNHVMSEGNLLWHVFSWELIDKALFLEGRKAKKAYDKVNKENAVYIEWFEAETRLITEELTKAKNLDKMTEVYVVASDFSWTYIKTHESFCGPYFIKL